jgi:uncharacterized membrane protein YqiK
MPFILKTNPRYEAFVKNYDCSKCGRLPDDNSTAAYKRNFRQQYKEHHGVWPQSPKIKFAISQEEADKIKADKKISAKPAAAVTDSEQLKEHVNAENPALFEMPEEEVKPVYRGPHYGT